MAMYEYIVSDVLGFVLEDVHDYVMQQRVDAVRKETDDDVRQHDVLVLHVLRQDDVHEETLENKEGTG